MQANNRHASDSDGSARRMNHQQSLWAAGEITKPPEGGFHYAVNRLLDHTDVRGLHAFGATHCFKLHALVFFQRLEAIAGDGGEVREQVVAAAFSADEAKTFLVVEPLDCTDCHLLIPN